MQKTKKGATYKERRIVDHHVQERVFRDMDGGSHFKLLSFSISNRQYPIGSGDILRAEEIDWEHTKEVKA